MTARTDDEAGTTANRTTLTRRAALGVAVLAAGGATAAWLTRGPDASPPTGHAPTEPPGEATGAPPASALTSETVATVGEDGFDITHGTVRVSAPAGVAPPGTRIAVSTSSASIPPEVTALSTMAGRPVSIVLGDDQQPEQPVTIAFDLRGTDLAASISETMQPVVMTWSDSADSLGLISGEWDAENETLTATTEHLSEFLEGLVDIGRYIWDTIEGFLGIDYTKPDCAFVPRTIGSTPYSVSHSGDDPIWPCLSATDTGGLLVELHSNSNMAWAVASRPSVSGSVTGGWKDLGPGLAAIYQGIFRILGEDRAAVMPGGSVRLPFDPGGGEIRIEIRQSPVLYIIATTLQAIISVLHALPTGRVADAVLDSFSAFDCITEEINAFYQEESADIARSVVLTTISCVSGMIEEQKGGFNIAVRTALAAVGMVSAAATTLIGAIQGMLREFTGSASATYTITAQAQGTSASNRADGVLGQGTVPMFRGNAARTGAMPGPGPNAADDVERLWAFDGYGTPPSTSPAISDGVAYVGRKGWSLYAVDTVTGAERWQAENADGFVSAPAVGNGAVYVGSIDGHLYAFEAASGAERWRFATGDSVHSSPAVVDDALYFGSLDTNLYAADAASGTERWRFRASDGVLSAPAVVDERVYFGDVAGHFYVIDAATGEERWRFRTGDQIRAAPAVVDDVVYFGSNDGYLYALDAGSGSERWRFVTEHGSEMMTSPAVVDGMVYIGNNDGCLYAVDAGTGRERWRFQTGYSVQSSPGVVDGVVYFGGSDGYLYALDAASGAELWRSAMDSRVWDSSPAIVDGVVYIGGGATLFAIGARS